ncbi:hypothetical protein JXM83_00010 [Candidatus Woesearchaeota archaeon]|nr:hypothetical protein [Candidatus Woesearchaeota archaeon]
MKLRKISKENKRGISAIIGYVLLVTFGLIMAVVAYNYLKTYVPKDLVECPDGTSIFIKDYNCVGNTLEITIKNNGKFNYAGYYIHAANTTAQKIATINLAEYLIDSDDKNARNVSGSYIMFSAIDDNLMIPQKESKHIFNLPHDIAILELTPVRYQQEGNTLRFVSCSNAKTKEEIICN